MSEEKPNPFRKPAPGETPSSDAQPGEEGYRPAPPPSQFGGAPPPSSPDASSPGPRLGGNDPNVSGGRETLFEFRNEVRGPPPMQKDVVREAPTVGAGRRQGPPQANLTADKREAPPPNKPEKRPPPI